MYKLKAMAHRGALLTAAAVVAVAAYLPAPSAFADALNPLTDRSLTLSSSSPGWDYTDGSGNTTYAPPNSGANGQKTGNTFDFKVSTDTTATGDEVNAMTFQYCTTSAGNCYAPGNNGFDGNDDRILNSAATTTSDLEVVTATPTEISSSDFGSIVVTSGSSEVAGSGTITTTTVDGEVIGVNTEFTSELTVGDTITTAGNNSYEVAAIADDTHLTLTTTPGAAEAGVTFTHTVANSNAGEVKAIPAADNSQGNYVVYYESAPGTWTQSTDWTMTASNNESAAANGDRPTGTNNFITLTNTAGQGFAAGTRVKVVFFGTNTNYITNPGAGAFFVKINTYDDPSTFNENTLIDGGVTVANVMNHSIAIQTKVLETMEFSVGTVDPNTLESDGTTDSDLYKANGNTTHGSCDRILTGMTTGDPVNVLKLGNQTGEDSLDTDITYSTHSYWRLSSNSSAGATVYYSGVTLSNTVGDVIEAIGPNKEAPLTGTEQFGLAIASDTSDPSTYAVDWATETDSNKVYENGADGSPAGVHASTITDNTGKAAYHAPQLYPLIPEANYNDGAGTVNLNYTGTSDPITTAFAFDTTSNTIPVPIASEDSQVVDCVTAKMRYIANIAATTPAGVYTTKINYIAAPQY